MNTKATTKAAETVSKLVNMEVNEDLLSSVLYVMQDDEVPSMVRFYVKEALLIKGFRETHPDVPLFVDGLESALHGGMTAVGHFGDYSFVASVTEASGPDALVTRVQNKALAKAIEAYASWSFESQTLLTGKERLELSEFLKGESVALDELVATTALQATSAATDVPKESEAGTPVTTSSPKAKDPVEPVAPATGQGTESAPSSEATPPVKGGDTKKKRKSGIKAANETANTSGAGAAEGTQLSFGDNGNADSAPAAPSISLEEAREIEALGAFKGKTMGEIMDAVVGDPHAQTAGGRKAVMFLKLALKGFGTISVERVMGLSANASPEEKAQANQDLQRFYDATSVICNELSNKGVIITPMA